MSATSTAVANAPDPAGGPGPATPGPFELKGIERFDAPVLAGAGIGPGSRVVDLASPAGNLAVAAARLVGTDGQVCTVGVPTGQQVDLGVAARHHGVRHLDLAADLAGVPAGPWSAAVSRFGLAPRADLPEVLAGLRQLLAPGATLSFATWAEPEANGWWAIPRAALAAHVAVPGTQPPAGPGPFALADPERIRAELAGAGFADVAVERWQGEVSMAATVNEAVATLERSPVLADVPPAVEAAVLTTLRVSLVPYARPGGVALRAAVWFTTARVPA